MTMNTAVRVAIVPKAGIFDIKNTNDTLVVEGGSDAEVLNILSQAIPFRYKILLPKEPIWGDRMVDGYWTGAVGMVHRNEADLALGKISVTEDRALILHHSYPYHLETLAFATRVPGHAPKYAAIASPFGGSLWMAIAVAAVLTIAAFKLLLRGRRSGVVMDTFGTLVGQQVDLSRRTGRDKLLTGGWLLGSLVLSLSYRAVLLSSLTVPEREWVPGSLNQLAREVCAGRYRCFTFEGDSHALTFLQSSEPSVRCMGEEIAKNQWRVPPLPHAVAEQLEGCGGTAVLAPKFFFQNVMAGRTRVADASLASLSRAIFFRKDFCCKEVVDKFVHRMGSGGFYERYLNLQLHQARFRSSSVVVDGGGIKSLTLVDVSCAFLILGAGFVVAGVVCAYEVWCESKRKGKEEQPVRLALSNSVKYDCEI